MRPNGLFCTFMSSNSIPAPIASEKVWAAWKALVAAKLSALSWDVAPKLRKS